MSGAARDHGGQANAEGGGGEACFLADTGLATSRIARDQQNPNSVTPRTLSTPNAMAGQAQYGSVGVRRS
jgi:hypothetical protein